MERSAYFMIIPTYFMATNYLFLGFSAVKINARISLQAKKWALSIKLI